MEVINFRLLPLLICLSNAVHLYFKADNEHQESTNLYITGLPDAKS